MPRASLKVPKGNPASLKDLPRGAKLVVTNPAVIASQQDDRDHAARLIRLAILAQLVCVAALFVPSESMNSVALGVIVAVWLFRPKSCGVPYRFILLVAIAFAILVKRIETTVERSGFIALAALIAFAILFRNHYLGMTRFTGPQKFNRDLNVKRGSILRGFGDALVLWLTSGRHGAPMPSHYRSPAGGYHFRLALTIGVMVMLAFPFYSYPQQLALTDEEMMVISPEVFSVIASFNLSYLLPLPLMVLAAFLLSLTILRSGHAARIAASQDDALAAAFYPMLDAIKASSDPDERESIPIGQVVHDNSSVLLPVSEGAHYAIFGSSGAGKTAMLLRLSESFFYRGDVSFIVLDLKSDTNELYYTLDAVAERARTDETPVPFWRFSNRTGDSSHLCSIFNQDFWLALTPEQRADVLLDAMGLSHSRSFGESWFTDCSHYIASMTFRKYPDIRSFRELHARIEYELNNPKQSHIPKSVLLDGVHIQLVLSRLAALEAMNNDGQHPHSVIDNAWDFKRFYQEPCIGYSALAAQEGPITAPEIARIQIAAMIRTGLWLPHSERRMKVIILVDEFARILAGGLDMLLQQARSTGASFMLTAQSVADLEQGKIDLTSSIENNTAAQLWFKSIDRKGIEQIERLGGETTERFKSESVSNGPHGDTYTSGYSEQLISRLKANEILHAASRRHHYICRISDNERYAHYDGLPFVATTGGYHITADEYERRKRPWPEKTPDTITVGEGPSDGPTGSSPIRRPPSGPVVDTGTIGGSSLRERKRTRE